MVNWIVQKLIKWCERTNRVVAIYDRDAQGNRKGTLYLVRYMVFHSEWFCLYIHRFMKSDLETLHDHPWNFFTYVVSGGYREHRISSELYNKYKVWPAEFISSETRRTSGSIAYRRAKDIHRVILDREYSDSEIKKAPLTVCLIGPRLREWGFWVPVEGTNSLRWVLWTEFLGVNPSDKDFKGQR